jgi:uncharacterized protein (TIGR02569 family)
MSRPPQPSSGAAPPAAVLAAFGAVGTPTLLAGGMRRTWRCGDLVLKPVDGPPGQHDWVCEVYDAWPADAGVRVPQPVRAAAGSWAVGGWAAHRWVEGRTARVAEDPAAFRRTAEAFHAAVAGLDRPGFLADRDDPWTFGDRVAFEEEEPVGPDAVLDLLRPLLEGRRPLDLPSQPVHGDLGGNVLRHPGLPDAVIDWPPYFRPRGFALAVVAGDAVAWEDAPPELLEAWADEPAWDQLLVRALAYRVATRGRQEALLGPASDPSAVRDYVAARRPSVDLVMRRLQG